MSLPEPPSSPGSHIRVSWQKTNSPHSMLAVMTMNVGYFMSVLGGVFLGSLAVGRFTGASEH